MAGLENPYADLRGKWIRGSFHGHCSEHSACASVPLATSVRDYHNLGVGFVTLTDHDIVTDLQPMRERYGDLTFLHGFEYSTRENVVFVGPQVAPLYELPLETALSEATDLLTIVCHPQPHADGSRYWTREMLEALGTMPDGIEVYNGHYGIETALANGRWPLYSGFWDEMLTAGHRVWGYANDDFHDPEDFGNAFNMVCVDEVSPAGIVRATKLGRCYASTGLLLQSVSEAEGDIDVVVEAPCTGVFVGPGGEELARSEGTHFTYRASGKAYVRFEAESQNEGRLFLQPMFAL